jgi:hypothetical protein
MRLATHDVPNLPMYWTSRQAWEVDQSPEIRRQGERGTLPFDSQELCATLDSIHRRVSLTVRVEATAVYLASFRKYLAQEEYPLSLQTWLPLNFPPIAFPDAQKRVPEHGSCGKVASTGSRMCAYADLPGWIDGCDTRYTAFCCSMHRAETVSTTAFLVKYTSEMHVQLRVSPSEHLPYGYIVTVSRV